MPDVASVTEPSTNVFQPESPEEPSGTGSKSSSNPLGGEGVVDWLEQLQNTFHQMGGKPILPNPQGLDSFEFYSPIAQKILEQIQQLKDSGVLDGYANLSNLDKDGLALLCMLFTQQSKSELIRGLQNALAAKVQERSATQKEFLDQQLKVLNDTIELQLAAEEQKKSALVKSIFGIIAAVFTAIVATVVTVASFGAAAGPAAVLLVVALSCTIAASATSIASSAMTIEALNDPELAEKYKDHIRNLGIASMVLGVVGSLMSVGAGGATSCTGVAKAVKTGGQIAGALCTIGQGTVDILKGCNMIELAEQNKELEVKRMELEKLDSEIDFLQKLIDSLTRSVQEFLDLFLNAEQTAAQEVLRMVDAQLTIVDEIPRTA